MEEAILQSGRPLGSKDQTIRQSHLHDCQSYWVERMSEIPASIKKLVITGLANELFSFTIKRKFKKQSAFMWGPSNLEVSEVHLHRNRYMFYEFTFPSFKAPTSTTIQKITECLIRRHGTSQSIACEQDTLSTAKLQEWTPDMTNWPSPILHYLEVFSLKILWNCLLKL